MLYLYDLNDERSGTIPARFFGLETERYVTEDSRRTIQILFNEILKDYKYIVRDKVGRFDAIKRGRSAASTINLKNSQSDEDEFAEQFADFYSDAEDIYGDDMEAAYADFILLSQEDEQQKNINVNDIILEDQQQNYVNMDEKDIILEETKKVLSHDGECIFLNLNGNLPDIPKEKLYKIREISNIDKNTEILVALYDQAFYEGDFWKASRTKIWSTIFLEDRICIRHIEETSGWDKNSDYINDIFWHDIEEVSEFLNEVKTDDGKIINENMLRFFPKNDNKLFDIPLDYFGGLFNEHDRVLIKNLLNSIVQKLDNRQNEYTEDLSQIFESISNNSNNGEYQIALDIIVSNFDINSLAGYHVVDSYFILFYYSSCLKGLGKNKEALKVLNDLIFADDESDEVKDWKHRIYKLKAELNDILENYYISMQEYYVSSVNTQNMESKNLIIENLESTYLKFKEIFSKLNYQERKMILVYDDIKVIPSNNLIVLDKNNLPCNLKFPFSHPKKEEIYIGHPFVNDIYLPFSTYESSLFNDRFEEFSYFIQCLGAKSMTIKVIKGIDKSTTDNETSNTDVSLGIGKSDFKNTLNVNYDKNKYADENENSVTKRTRTQVYNPRKKPYIPSNLLWYPQESSWSRLYQQRINGNILQHHDMMSSKSTHSINTNEKTNLKVDLKYFFAEINVNRDAFIESSLNETESIEWEISVEFESIENLKETHIESETILDIPDSFSDVEEEYLAEVKYMIEDDGVIDEKERKSLERFRVKKGISLERALELENRLSSSENLNESEIEYLEEYQELINEGDIMEKERRTLNRMANRLGISEERVSQLEGLRTV